MEEVDRWKSSGGQILGYQENGRGGQMEKLTGGCSGGQEWGVRENGGGGQMGRDGEQISWMDRWHELTTESWAFFAYVYLFMHAN
jgi:hypothetical protein